MTHQEIKDITKLIKGFKKEIENIMPTIKQDIDHIISNHIEDVKEIENILDTLLDYLDLGYGEQEFKKLNKYYSTINKENSRFYSNFYNERFGK